MKVEVSRKNMISVLNKLPKNTRNELINLYDLIDDGWTGDDDGDIFDYHDTCSNMLDECLLNNEITQEYYTEVKETYLNVLYMFLWLIINN